jgi:hypothetical protein
VALDPPKPRQVFGHRTEDGLQMLSQWKKHLGLDDEPSWIMTSELIGPLQTFAVTALKQCRLGFCLTR